jgi:hypothetical protein
MRRCFLPPNTLSAQLARKYLLIPCDLFPSLSF